MTINVFAMVLTMRQNRFKFITNLSALAKTNPILTITLFIISFHI
jgi:NADH-ubiquinone oxidoreductase chain 2